MHIQKKKKTKNANILEVLNAITETKSETFIQWASSTDTQAKQIAGTVNVQRFSMQLLHREDGRRGPATWLVLVGMTDQACSNHVRLWSEVAGSLLRPSSNIHNGCSSCLLLPPLPFREGKGSQRGSACTIEFRGGARWV